MKNVKITLFLVALMLILMLFGSIMPQSAKSDDVKYDIWLGNTQVTEANKNDILGDGGKAKYDSANRILILNNPTISGVYKRTNGNETTCKIFIGSRFTSVRISGTYDMKSADAVNGLYSETWINFTGGSFKFYGSDYGIRAASISITGGSVYAEGGINGVFNSQNSSGTYVMIYDQGVLTRAEFKGGSAAMGTKVDINSKNILVTTPSNGVIGKNDDKIYESDGKTLPKHVALEQQYTVSFNANGHGSAPASQQVGFGVKVKKPADPKAEGYLFGGWFTNQNCTSAYSFDTGISSDTTIYAKWTEYVATPTPTATNTPVPTLTKAPTPKATRTPTTTAANTPAPTATKTPTPAAAKTPTTASEITPALTSTKTPTPKETETPEPEATDTPEPEASETPAPEATEPLASEVINTQAPDFTATPSPVETPSVTEPTVSKESENSKGSCLWLWLVLLLLIILVIYIIVKRRRKKKQ